MTRKQLRFATLITLILPGPMLAADWPQFKRDAARSGDAAAEVLAFPLNRITAVRFPAPIYASPAVVGGHVYVQDALGNLACVDGASNQVRWVTHIGGVTNMSSPAVAHGRVYVGSSAGYLAIVDARDGKLLKKVPGEGGVITAPALANDAVYFSTLNAKLVKIDPDGNVRWTFSGGPGCHVDFAVRDQEILCFGLASENQEKPGREWSAILYRLKDEGDQVSVVAKTYTMEYPTGGPTFGPGQQCGYQSWSGERGGFIIVRWDDDPKGKFHFWQGDLTDSRAVPSMRGGRYFLADRTGIVCLEPGAPPRTVWHSGGWPYYGPNGFHSSPALSKEHVIAGSDDGRVYFFPIELAGQDRNKIQKAVWSYATSGADQVNGGVSSSPAIADGKVFFGGEDGILYGLGAGRECAVVELPGVKPAPRGPPAGPPALEWHTAGGDMGYSAVSPDTHLKPPFRIRWRTRVWGSFKGGMIVAGGRVFAAGRSGALYALDADTGQILWKTRTPYVSSWPPPTFADGKLLVLRSSSAAPKGQEGGGLWCHDAATGKLLWRKTQPIATGDYDFSGGVVVHQGTVLGCWHTGKGALEAAAFKLDSGEVVWSKNYPGVLPAEGKGRVHVSQGCVGDGTWFCSLSRTGASGKVDREQGQGGATLAIDAKTGNRLWLTDRCFVTKESRVSYRNGTVVVFDGYGGMTAHALNPKTGEPLWTSRVASTQLNPLTDAFLESQGKKGVSGASFCGYHVFANGHFYGTDGFSQTRLLAKEFQADGKTPIVWSHMTMARSCPAPTPAYGRLYYAANDEGVIFCFENSK